MSTIHKQLEASIEREDALVHTDRRSVAIEKAAPNAVDPLLALMDKMANNPNITPEMVGKMMDVYIDGQRKMATMSDEQAFAHAMANFKKNPPDIIKNRVAKMEKDGRHLYSYNFADLDAFASAAQVGLAERGITWSFPFSEAANGVITVSCVLRYGLYQHTPTILSSPPDQTGGKNAIQAKASTLSYLERYTFCGATGLTAGMPDTDGKTPAPQAEPECCLEEGAAADFLASIEGSGSVEELHQNYFKARDAAEAAKDKNAAKVFAGCKNVMFKKHPEWKQAGAAK